MGCGGGNGLVADAAAAGQGGAGSDGQSGQASGEPSGGRRRGRLLGLLLPLVAAPALGAGAYFAVTGGYVPGPLEAAEKLVADAMAPTPKAPPAAFVTLPRLTISLGPSARARHLRVAVTLEVEPGTEDAVTEASPRLVAALTRFLRAVDERDFEQPALMARLQEQLLRRLEFNAPPGALRAVLFQEFLLN
ncbi:MAG: flagellar basal body-associated FliL family protein [Pseudomonadota bacterium]